MRIAIVNQHPDDVTGGSELQCELVARGLSARAHDVLYLAVEVGALPARHVVAGSAAYRTRRVARTPDAIVAACVAEDVDVVYWRFNRPLLRPVVTRLADRGIAVVLAVAHIDDVSRWPVRPWPRAPLQSIARTLAAEARTRIGERSGWGALRHVAAVASQREDFLGRVPVDDQRVIRNLMSPELVPFHHPRPYVAWVGSLQRRKRPELLPHIAATVAPFGLDVLVAGQIREPRFSSMFGDDQVNLQHMGLLPVATTIGLIAGAQLLVVTAEEEGFANVLIQAWWYGTPTVSLSHDPDGLIAAHDLGASCSGDTAAFLRATVKILEEDGAAAAARRARIEVFAHDRFAEGATLDALEDLLRDVVARS